MKKNVLLVVLFFCTSCCLATTKEEVCDSVSSRVSLIEKRLHKHDTQITDAINAKSAVVKEVDSLKNIIAQIKLELHNNGHSITVLDELISEQHKTFSGKMEETNETILERTYIIFCVLLLVLFCILSVYWWLRRYIKAKNNNIDVIKKGYSVLQEECVKLDQKMMELLEKQMEVIKELKDISKNGSSSKNLDHSLALKIANEIVRVEVNLSRMDPAVKGYRQLSSSVRRIKENFMANGYEIVNMLGKEYNEGMKVIANFIPDENLKEGEQIITGIIKPQVNYNGVMIQAAQITVSQN